MKGRPGQPIKLGLLVVLIGVAGYALHRLHGVTNATQEIKYDLALMQDARYGVLNAHEWKRQVSEIIADKIDEFELDPNNGGRLKIQIENALYKLIDELAKFLEQEGRVGNAMEKMIKSMAFKVAFTPEKFKAQVPEWSEQILKEIDNDDTRRELKEYLREKIEELLAMNSVIEDTSVLDAMATKYACNDRSDCGEVMQEKIGILKLQAWQWGGVSLGALLLVFLIVILMHGLRFWSAAHIMLIVACLLALYGGLSLPMIDIDARIGSLGFNLMGEQIVFRDQVLFFQSKSILQVVRLLIDRGDFQTRGVGILILLFSVVFPILKMIASAIVVARPERLRSSRVAYFLVLKSGKWSMADVFVVAIFMAYIGFRGIIDSQISQLQRANEGVNMITTHEYTTLQLGFLMFTCFCLFSLTLSTLLDRQIKQPKAT